MTRMKPFDLFFMFCVFAFAAVGVAYFSAVFTVNTRWLVLLALLAVLLFSGQLFRAFQLPYSLILVIYGLWCICTIAWSYVPVLTSLKSIIFCLIAVAFLSGGYVYGMRNENRKLLYLLAPIAALAIFAGFFSRGRVAKIGNVEVYYGLTGNPNFLGLLIAMASPFAIWFLYDNWHSKRYRILALVIAGLLLTSLWMSGSRAAILCVLFVVTGFFWAITYNRRLVIAGLLVAITTAVLVAVPAVEDALTKRIIYKGQDTEQGVFYSRQTVWSESYEYAKEAGFIGVGYGVSADDRSFNLRFSRLAAFTYGREKGNTQLAVWEETGLIGLALYTALLISIIGQYVRAFSVVTDPHDRALLGLLLGTILGMTANSAFEGWWVAPGSTQLPYFFAIVGIGSALIAKLRQESRSRQAPLINARAYYSPAQ